MFKWFQSLVSIRYQELNRMRRELRREAKKYAPGPFPAAHIRYRQKNASPAEKSDGEAHFSCPFRGGPTASRFSAPACPLFRQTVFYNIQKNHARIYEVFQYHPVVMLRILFQYAVRQAPLQPGASGLTNAVDPVGHFPYVDPPPFNQIRQTVIPAAAPARVPPAVPPAGHGPSGSGASRPRR